MNRKICLLLLALNLLFVMGISVHSKKAHKVQSMAMSSFSTSGSLTSGAMYHLKSDYANKYLEGRDSNGLGMVGDWDYSDDEFWTAEKLSNGRWTLKNLKYQKYLQITSSGAQMSDTAQELIINLDSDDNYCIKSASGGNYLSYKTSFQGRTACASQEKWNLWSNTPIAKSDFWLSNQAYSEHYIQIEEPGSVKPSDGKQDDANLRLSKSTDGYWQISRSGIYLAIYGEEVGYNFSYDSQFTKLTLEAVDDGKYYCIRNYQSSRYLRLNRYYDVGTKYELITADHCESQEKWLVQQS